MGEQLTIESVAGTMWVGEGCGCVPPVTARGEISRLQAAGLGPTAIARRLNAGGVSTPSGRGRWYPETVIRHVDRDRWNAYMRQYRARHR